MFTITTIKLVVLALMLVLASSTAMAEPRWCGGTVSRLFMYRNGEVYVVPSWRNDGVRVCNINQDSGTVTPQNCAAWFSLLRNAATNKENTVIFYDDAPACDTMPTYNNAPVPGYVMLVD